MGHDVSLQQNIIQLFHSSPLGGYSGMVVIKKKLGNLFYWKGLSKDVRNFVRNCYTCQRNKADLSATAGLL